jgi:hypothetical protein
MSGNLWPSESQYSVPHADLSGIDENNGKQGIERFGCSVTVDVDLTYRLRMWSGDPP